MELYRGGADSRRLSRLPCVLPRHRPVHGLEHRQQRQFRFQRDGRRHRLGIELRDQIARAQLPAGPERRRRDRRPTYRDRDRVVRFDQPGASGEQLLLLSRRRQQRPAVQVRRIGSHGGSVCRGAISERSRRRAAIRSRCVLPGTDQYTVWNTDSNGNVVSNGTGGVIVSGASSALKSLEPSFHQDLNGDGVIGGAAARP